MNHKSEALQRAVVKQIRNSHQLRQQIALQVVDVIRTGKTSSKITLKVPVPTDEVKPDFAPNRNRGKRRFVLNGYQKSNRREL
jgi:hypothetical protein